MATKQKILIVDDDTNIAELISLYLTKECYETKMVHDGESALKELQIFQPNLILLDLMLPGMKGEELTTFIRNEKKSNVPIIILSAKTALENKVELIRLGADDYITKPFEPQEVLVRVMAALRRAGNGATGEVNQGMQDNREQPITYKNLILNPISRTVKVKEQEISLTPHEYEILFILLQQPEKVFSRDTLYETVWENGYFGEDNTVNVHVSNIRKKIAAIDKEEEYIKTVWGIGFKMA